MFEDYRKTEAAPTAPAVTVAQHVAITEALRVHPRAVKAYIASEGLGPDHWNLVVETNHAIVAAARGLVDSDKVLKGTVEDELSKTWSSTIVGAVLAGMQGANGGTWTTLRAALVAVADTVESPQVEPVEVIG